MYMINLGQGQRDMAQIWCRKIKIKCMFVVTTKKNMASNRAVTQPYCHHLISSVLLCSCAHSYFGSNPGKWNSSEQSTKPLIDKQAVVKA